MSTLKSEFDYYLANQAEIVAKYQGKYVVIKDHAVVGAYESVQEAVDESKKTMKQGTFLVQLATPGDASYTQTFHSRASFA